MPPFLFFTYSKHLPSITRKHCRQPSQTLSILLPIFTCFISLLHFFLSFYLIVPILCTAAFPFPFVVVIFRFIPFHTFMSIRFILLDVRILNDTFSRTLNLVCSSFCHRIIVSSVLLYWIDDWISMYQ